MVDVSADSPRSMTDQMNIVLESHRNKHVPKQLSADISAHTSETHKFDTKGSGKIMPRHLSCTTSKTMSSDDLPDQQFPLTISPDRDASGSALDFLWATACAEAVQNPVGDIGADQGGSECVDRADPFAVDWVAWPLTGPRACFSVSAGGAIQHPIPHSMPSQESRR